MIICGCCGCCVLGVGPTPRPPSPGNPRPPPGPPSSRPPKISRFFCPLPHNFNSFFPLLGVFSLNFGGVFEGRDPQMCTFGLSGLLCETPALAKVEIGQSSSRPSSLGLIEKKWKVFRFPWLFSFRGLFYLVFQALKIFSLEMPMEKEGPKTTSTVSIRCP